MKKNVFMTMIAISAVMLLTGCGQSKDADAMTEEVTNTYFESTNAIEDNSEEKTIQEESTSEETTAMDTVEDETTVTSATEEAVADSGSLSDEIQWGVTWSRLAGYAPKMKLVQYYDYGQNEVIHDAMEEGIDQTLTLNGDVYGIYRSSSSSVEFDETAMECVEESTTEGDVYSVVRINTNSGDIGNIQVHAILPDGRIYTVRNYFDFLEFKPVSLIEIYEVVI